MSKLDEKFELYRKTLVEKCNVTPDEELLKGVIKAMGPSIYNADGEIVAMSDKDEVTTLKENFVKKKLGLTDDVEVEKVVDKAFDTIGRSNPRKYRAVVCYLMVVDLGKELLFKK
ncbi:DUF2853 family protein [Pasteurella atlantica]|uniref:DUF2853 family protein n=1 Tax=Pasteurellaceae TaxID=712 RepID=UPI0027633E4B|nr:DUF2853 family protein [Pasteurella atlantica]MDP8099282.1 DUF2853 family protein [Pasteurella atlantica]MDP8106159.1 DUF2853 family protein [Pasteurella atlantica]MDP8115884.1 DUF2853 family protein [Pasteurella atlantica]